MLLQSASWPTSIVAEYTLCEQPMDSPWLLSGGCGGRGGGKGGEGGGEGGGK
jgi:hypothetical protein